MGNLTVRRPSDGAASPARASHGPPGRADSAAAVANHYATLEVADREHARCERLATIATRCAGFSLAGGLGFVCLLAALAAAA
jgi:hypothetical protein